MAIRKRKPAIIAIQAVMNAWIGQNAPLAQEPIYLILPASMIAPNHILSIQRTLFAHYHARILINMALLKTRPENAQDIAQSHCMEREFTIFVRQPAQNLPIRIIFREFAKIASILALNAKDQESQTAWNANLYTIFTRKVAFLIAQAKPILILKITNAWKNAPRERFQMSKQGCARSGLIAQLLKRFSIKIRKNAVNAILLACPARAHLRQIAFCVPLH